MSSSHPNFTVHIRETWKGPQAQRPSFIAKPHHNLRRLFEVYMLKKAGPPLETLICVYKDKTIAQSQYEQPLLELGFMDGDEITVYKIHFCIPEKEADIAVLPTSYQNDFRYLYNHKLFVDITFIIEGQKVTAHKCVLAARCEKFRAMLQNSFKEGQQSEIVLECKLAPFQAMLEYLYTDNIPSDCDLLFDVLALAEEYLLLQLKSICEVKLLENLDLYNAANLLVHADLYRCEMLKKYTLQFIMTSHELLVNVPQFESDIEKAPHLMMEIMRAISKGNHDFKRQKY
jgi:hypothetical protein